MNASPSWMPGFSAQSEIVAFTPICIGTTWGMTFIPIATRSPSAVKTAVAKSWVSVTTGDDDVRMRMTPISSAIC